MVLSAGAHISNLTSSLSRYCFPLLPQAVVGAAAQHCQERNQQYQSHGRANVFIVQSECNFVKILIIKYLRKYDSLSTMSEDPSKATCVLISY